MRRVAGVPMTFIQKEFLVFFVVVYALYWMAGRRRIQNLLLLVASVIFYGWVHPWFLILLYASSIVDYLAGKAIEDHPTHRRWWLALSMSANLGMLAYFKYCDFFLENVAAALTALGISHSVHTLGIFLPVGISFYTFQTMSYTLDIFMGHMKARRDFLDYAVFVSFFPQLVAGPVERATNLLVQVEKDRRFSWDDQRSGLALAVWGATKKVCVADVVGPYVDRVFVLQDPSWSLVALGAVGFSIQILADFSGYTDIGRGTARMLGFGLMKNFDHPYLSVDPSEFWRRWHISFSTWIRDYVYIPAGGSRGGWWGSTRSTWIAMLTSGLWHGASWNFILWGAFHAALLSGYRLFKPLVPAGWREAAWGRPAAILLMYGFTCIGWLIFRETHLDRLVMYATLAPWVGTHEQWVASAVLGTTLVLCAAPLVLALVVEWYVMPWLGRSRWALPAQATWVAVQGIAIVSFVRAGNNDFIYFQF